MGKLTILELPVRGRVPLIGNCVPKSTSPDGRHKLLHFTGVAADFLVITPSAVYFNRDVEQPLIGSENGGSGWMVGKPEVIQGRGPRGLTTQAAHYCRISQLVTIKRWLPMLFQGEATHMGLIWPKWHDSRKQ